MSSGMPAGFRKNLKRMSGREIKRSIRSLQRNIQRHRGKISDASGSEAVPHWESEIRAWEEQVEWLQDELTRCQKIGG